MHKLLGMSPHKVTFKIAELHISNPADCLLTKIVLLSILSFYLVE